MIEVAAGMLLTLGTGLIAMALWALERATRDEEEGAVNYDKGPRPVQRYRRF
jgi:hypothetical protein